MPLARMFLPLRLLAPVVAGLFLSSLLPLQVQAQTAVAARKFPADALAYTFIYNGGRSVLLNNMPYVLAEDARLFGEQGQDITIAALMRAKAVRARINGDRQIELLWVLNGAERTMAGK